MQDLFKIQDISVDKLPSFGISVLAGLVPVLLMAIAAIVKLSVPKGSVFSNAVVFLGDPVIALFIAVWVAIYTLGIRKGRSLGDLMNSLGDSVKAIAMILFIIAGGGAFKQVLVDSGISNYIVDLMKEAHISPLVLAWSIAAALRIALGSATVAALTAAGIVVPLIGQAEVNPELLVLATGAGSLTCSQVNDTGFWLFKEYFNLSVIETLKSWTLMETIVSICGLVGCLILDLFV